jgi:hypothetical protein
MMERHILIFAAGLACGGALFAQGGGRGGTITQSTTSSFQESGVFRAAPGSPVLGRSGGGGPLIVSGRPLTATEERKTVQTLGDGTVIEKSDSNKFFRDSMGRTRVEQEWEGRTVIAIMDPVARFFVQLDPEKKTARKSAISPNATTGGVSVHEGAVGYSTSTGGGFAGTVTVMPRTVVPGAGGGVGMGRSASMPKPVTEDLGSQSIGGVLAAGTRNTVTIPTGQIGNNRDINIVNERWYSTDLQMLIKTVNSDPRFGVTTYELKNVLQVEPSLNLFEIPADYTLTENTNRLEARPVIPVIKE